jgi:hypothetical protein
VKLLISLISIFLHGREEDPEKRETDGKGRWDYTHLSIKVAVLYRRHSWYPKTMIIVTSKINYHSSLITDRHADIIMKEFEKF